MGLHVIVGAGPVGTALAERAARRGEHVRVVTRSGSGVDGTEQVAPTPPTPTASTELARRRRRDLQLRQPAVRPVGEDVAADRRRAARRRRGQRRGAGHHRQPLRLRPGRRPDDRGPRWPPPARRARCATRCGATRSPRTRPAGSARSRSAAATTSAATRCWRRSSRRRWRKGRTRLRAGRPRRAAHLHRRPRRRRAARHRRRATSGRWGRAWHVPSDDPADRCATSTAIAAEQLGVEPKVRLAALRGGLGRRPVQPVRQGTARDAAPVPQAVRARLERRRSRPSA